MLVRVGSPMSHCLTLDCIAVVLTVGMIVAMVAVVVLLINGRGGNGSSSGNDGSG